MVAKGNWWAAAVQPAILGFGAIMAALNEVELPEMDGKNFEFANLMSFGNRKSKNKGRRKKVE